MQSAKATSAGSQNVMPLGVPGVDYGMSVAQGGRARVELYIDLEDADATCRHTGGSSASGFAAASSNCAWCARRVRAGSEPLGHHLKRPFDSRFVASQNPWPS